MTVRRRLITALSVFAFLGAVVMGCSNRPDSRLATFPGNPDSGPARWQALNGGVLALVSGCVVLKVGLGDEPMTLVLPAEVATFDGSAVTIRGKSFTLGTTVEVGGGGGSYSDMPSDWSVPTACRSGTDSWWATGDLQAE